MPCLTPPTPLRFTAFPNGTIAISPGFLFSRFGLGYKLTLVKAGEAFQADDVTRLVLSHVKNAQMLSSAGGETSFRLPRQESGEFPKLFRDLEAKREAMGIGGYGISITSLEEVFLSLEKEGKRTDNEKRIQTNTGNGFGDHIQGSNGFRDHIQGNDGFRGRTQVRNDNNSKTTTKGKGPVREIEMQGMGPVDVVNAGTIERENSEENNGNVNGDIRGDACSANKPKDGKVGNGNRPSNEPSTEHDEEDRAALLAEVQQEQPEDQEGQASPRHHAEGERLCGEPLAGISGREVREEKSGGTGLREQMGWLLWKRRVIAMRDWRGGLYQVLLPAVLVGLVLVLLTIDVGLAGPSLAMSANMFDGPTQVGRYAAMGVEMGFRIERARGGRGGRESGNLTIRFFWRR